MTAVEQAIEEINERLTTFAPQLEGLQDFHRLNLQGPTDADVLALTDKYQQRMALLVAARDACTALMSDGHPDIPIMEVDITALNDLKANAATIEAALLRFSTNAASALGLASGGTEKK